MLSRPVLESQQSAAVLPAGRAFPGCWKLGHNRAITLRPRERSVIEVAQGRVWLTFTGPHAGPGNDLGDRFLAAGDWQQVEAGQTVVIEPFLSAETAFRWDRVLPTVGSLQVASRPAVREWQRDVALPMADLGRALGLGWQAARGLLGASGRLLAGSLRFAWYALGPRTTAAAEAGTPQRAAC
ncbi:MAG: DUF2917 domain-containing protein [Curvibacter sp.]|nr:DUF2917 domain-containing protein [Curvibacter sp.]